MDFVVEIGTKTTNAKQEPITKNWEALAILRDASNFRATLEWLDRYLKTTRVGANKDFRIKSLKTCKVSICDLPEYIVYG